MSFAEAKELLDVWVYYRLDSGAVTQVRFVEPRAADLPAEGDGVGVIETSLSKKACGQVHQLVVRNGRVRVLGSLARRR
ncbi:MAG TPA: hypothetical protein VM389_12120 [Phycisphaerae bacterium]|nr:hypothetical protein [Phycisphaerae bacterium]HUU59768.1 hypothetical protein [Phycisphaerae bacterium]